MQHGKIQSNQAVTTFGVGSICDLSGSAGINSGIIAGLDNWPTDKATEILEPSLARSLNVKHLFPPPVGEELAGKEALPAYRFPKRLFCNKCGRIGFPGSHFETQTGQIPKCKKNGCSGTGFPPRLVVVCYDPDTEAPKGPLHGCIDDFPWEWWLFKGPKDWCDSPELFMVQSKKSFTLAGLRVECRCQDCKGEKRRSFENVFGTQALIGRTCRGKRPWLNDSVECGKNVRVLMRGASNVYFPVSVSSISIPPYSDALVREIFEGCNQTATETEIPVGTKIKIIRKFLPMVEHHSDDDIERAIQIIVSKDAQPVNLAGSRQQRNNERNALYNGNPGEGIGISDFVARPADEAAINRLPLLSENLSRLVHVTRLREVRALRGFTRVEIPFGSDPMTMECAKISREQMDWLPAVETRGEGFYLELNPERLEVWSKIPEVHNRVLLINNNILKGLESRGITRDQISPEKFPTAKFILIHTLSHLIIRQLSLESGYSTASIRERIYVNTPDDALGDQTPFHAGVLIYTATADADGTLGGLVRQSEPERLDPLIRSAIENARWCSSDPLCIESVGQGTGAENLAACHGCLLLPETSCENNNRQLDRALVVGTLDVPQTGFFGDV